MNSRYPWPETRVGELVGGDGVDGFAVAGAEVVGRAGEGLELGDS